MEILIENATVVDGSGSSAFESNVLIESERISYIGKERFRAKRIIDGRGLILTPGFIDTHSHSDFTIIADPRAEGKITQGITTEINGNCGVSATPIEGEVLERRKPEFDELGIKPWRDLTEFKEILKNIRPATNFAGLCGHGNLRGIVLGYRNIRAEKRDLDKMRELLRRELSQGVLGLSTGLIYPPGIFSTTEELIELSKTLKGFKAIYTTHIRSEGNSLLASIEEAITIGRKAKVPVHISHLKTSGEENWWKIEAVFAAVEEAQKEGVKITADRYPYTASATDLDAFLPSWIIEGSRDEIIGRLKTKRARAEIKRVIKEKKLLEKIIISHVQFEGHKDFEGKRLGELTNYHNAQDFVCDLLIHCSLNVGVIYFSMSEENLRKILSKPYVMIGTDSSARSTDGVTRRGKPHPRGFGSFPRFFRKYVFDDKLLSLEEAVRKCTSLPAKVFGLRGRGLIKEGYFADLVLFDPSEIGDRATYQEPFIISSGIKYVIVNGAVTVEDGVLTGDRNGRWLNLER